MAIKINWNRLRIEVNKTLKVATQKSATHAAEDLFEEAKSELLQSFWTHPISEEIRAGIEEESSTIGGVGSLYGFIGFESGSTPVEDLGDFLDKSIKLSKSPRYIESRKVWQFPVQAPSTDEINDAAPMPWGTSVSWVYAVEHGISGLNRFLSIQRYLENRGRLPKSPIGRSGGGIQVKVPLGAQGSYSPQTYLTSLLRFFARTVSGRAI